MSGAVERWAAVAALFDELVELAPDLREQRLAAVAADDAALAAELRALLAADDTDADLLDNDAAAALPDLMIRSDELQSGGRVGAWRLLRQIGEGGMGVVYLGERTDGAYEQQVAVKVLKRGMDTHAILRRFLQERRILARLSHPHIVRLVDGGMSADGRPFYVMEFVDGVPITVHAREERLDVRARVALLAAVAEAVAYAHTQLIVHRDLKPSNVLVDAAGSPRVLDFGIAKVIEESGEQTRTGTGLRVLSPAYAAPEQIVGGAIGTATDVYALGLMLCELLAGQLPQRSLATTPEELARQAAAASTQKASALLSRLTPDEAVALYGADADARRLARTLAGDIDLIIATALRPEPERRYPTAAAFGDDLQRWLDGRPIAARADSTAYRFTKFVRRHRIGVAASALVVLSLVGGLGVALWQTHNARLAATAALAAEEKARQQAAIATAVSDFLARDVIEAVNPYRNKLDIRLADALIGAGKNIDARFAGNPRLAGVVRRELAESLYLAGEVEEAQKQAKLALDTLEGAFGRADTDALETRVVLGRVMMGHDDYAGARALYNDGLAAIKADGPVRTRLALAVGLAGVDVEQRREAEALAALDKLAPQIEAEFGAFEPLHIEALNHRLRTLVNIERTDEALALARRLRAGTEKKFGVGHALTLEWIKREAIVLVNMERYDEALPIMQQTCAATRANFGDAHYATQDCNLRLGQVLFEKLRFAEATALFEPAAAYREKTLGVDSEKTWVGWIWLARGYQRLDRLKEARALFERAHASAIRVNGENHRNTLPFGQTLGMFLEQTGAHADAEKLRRKLLAQSQAEMPAGHINIAKYAWDLGETLASQQHDDDTVAFYATWLPEWDRQFPEDDSRRIDAHKWLDAAQQRIAARDRTRK